VSQLSAAEAEVMTASPRDILNGHLLGNRLGTKAEVLNCTRLVLNVSCGGGAVTDRKP